MAKERVVIAMSGGVDSSVAAALLKEQGYEVIGITMRLSAENRDFSTDDRGCCNLKSVDDARHVAEILGIRHYVVDFQDIFQKKVIQYFLDSYLNCETPNPCIACNHFIKFKALMQKAKSLGASYLATGHYARIEKAGSRFVLKKGCDSNKDQSYALYHLNQESLANFLLPLGAYKKDITRELARRFSLPVAQKPDSQEICFIPNDNYKAYLKKQVPDALRPGNICLSDGTVVGHHDGLPFYTIGQRKGLGIAYETPLYVIRLDKEKNTVIVGESSECYSSELYADDMNWILFDSLDSSIEAAAKIRYGKQEASAMIYPMNQDSIRVIFAEPQRAITPGQSIVLYNGDAVIGGGVIRSVKQQEKG